jgi:short-subunit dehydrogenase
LRHELEGSTVGVSVVHPGGVATSIARNARVPRDAPADEIARGRKLSEKLLRMAPDTAGEIIARGIERRQARILVGNDAKFVSFLERLAPVAYWRILKKATAR